MRASSDMNWRRWVAMLCIALLGFIMLEEASPAHAAADNAQAGITFLLADAEGAAVESAGGGEQTPASPAQPQHHCCAAHCNGMTPALASSVVTAQVMLRVAAPRSTHGAPTGAPNGLERPPKATAIV
ncbi:MAG: hypothetical protein KF779_18060 [Hyphomonadaceae bacterium]|nr:hypothetical protein [Caulobacterales bacterium]MBX3431494.1 hypothetical protein [Hyphomonadaceae bacterium]